MKNLLKQKKILFDGYEEEFHHASSKIKCVSCAGTVEINFSNLSSISKMANQHALAFIPEVKGIQSIKVGDHIFYKYEYLPVVGADVSCEKCQKKYIAILGAGEFQPARYMVVLGGLFEF